MRHTVRLSRRARPSGEESAIADHEPSSLRRHQWSSPFILVISKIATATGPVSHRLLRLLLRPGSESEQLRPDRTVSFWEWRPTLLGCQIWWLVRIRYWPRC